MGLTRTEGSWGGESTVICKYNCWKLSIEKYRNHMVCIVAIDGQDYHVDVGFGKYDFSFFFFLFS